MPEIKVIKHLYREDPTLNSHAREGEWFGPKFVLWITYYGYPMELVLRRNGNVGWEASNLFHDELFLYCPICGERATKKCKKAASRMDQVAEAGLNSPSFRLIALVEM